MEGTLNAQYDQMQVDTDAIHFATGPPLGEAPGEGPLFPPPGIQKPPDLATIMQQIMQSMMQMMMEEMRASFQQVVPGTAGAVPGLLPPRHSVRQETAIGGRIRTWPTCVLTNVRSVALKSSRTKGMSGKSGVLNS